MTAVSTNSDDREYHVFLEKIQARLSLVTEQLFVTDQKDLYESFLAALPASEYQYHNCSACKRFVNTYGGLATINSDGTLESPLWSNEDAPELYQGSIRAMLRQIKKAHVVNVFYDKANVWGNPITGGWRHLSAVPSSKMVYTERALSAGQKRAEKREDYSIVCRALADLSLEIIQQVVSFLQAEALYRSERFIGPAQWLLTLKTLRETVSGKKRDNLTWKAVATAPAGYCHPKSTAIGTLFDDITAGLSFEEVKRKFAAITNPTVYQRSTVAPTTGAIKQAEKLFADMGLASALARRYATLEELPTSAMVRSYPIVAASMQLHVGGVFSHLQPKGTPVAVGAVPTVTMTWEKFQRTVLPTAREIEALVPATADRFMALVTASDQDAPPILQWDNDQERNAFSWYYASGIDAEMNRRLVEAGGRTKDNAIRCSLMWDDRNDLDLHCVTPRGDHIYYGNKNACRYGGALDVDRNVRGETMTPVENIRWAKGTALAGRYRFSVNLYGTHGGYRANTPFTVEIEVDGQVFTVSGVSIGVGSTIDVADFDYTPDRAIVLRGATNVQRAATSANVWGVAPGSYVPVTAVVKSPNLWSQSLEQHGKHVFFLLKDCRDTQQGVGRGFFNEMLKAELRPVRSVLEAYAAGATIEGDAGACGIGISSSSTGDMTLRVTSPNGRAVYKLDRWD